MKTIAVHLCDDQCYNDRLAFGINLAFQWNAHLIAIYTLNSTLMPDIISGRGASLAYIAEAKKNAEKKEQQIEKQVKALVEGKGLSWEIQCEVGSPVDILQKYSHYVDLVIISQTDPINFEGRMLTHLPDRLPMTSGSPVLILPFQKEANSKIENVMIAWKDSKEASHTLHQALPILKEAKNVYLLCPEEDEMAKSFMPAYLSRHDIHVHIIHDDTSINPVGERINQQAQNYNCDLIIMGSYGRSHFSEMIWGGVTKYILNNMKLPIFTAH